MTASPPRSPPTRRRYALPDLSCTPWRGPRRGRAPAYPAGRHVLQVAQIELLDGVGLPGHLKHVGRVHLVLNRNRKVVRKLPAVDGGRHQDDLRAGRPGRQSECGRPGGSPHPGPAASHLPRRQRRRLGLSWDALTASFHSLFKHLSSEELQGPSDAAPVSLKGTSREPLHQKQLETEGTGGGAPGGGAAAKRTAGRPDAGGSDQGAALTCRHRTRLCQREGGLVVSSQNSREAGAAPQLTMTVCTTHPSPSAQQGERARWPLTPSAPASGVCHVYLSAVMANL